MALRAASAAGRRGPGHGAPFEHPQRIEALYLRLHSAALPRAVTSRQLSRHWPAQCFWDHFADAAEVPAPEADKPRPSRSQKTLSDEAAQARLSVLRRGSNDEGRPLPGATVQVHSAGVRTGTNSYVHLLCRLRQARGAGRRRSFAIASLDPTLVFQLLVIADGYAPTF